MSIIYNALFSVKFAFIIFSERALCRLSSNEVQKLSPKNCVQELFLGIMKFCLSLLRMSAEQEYVSSSSLKLHQERKFATKLSGTGPVPEFQSRILGNYDAIRPKIQPAVQGSHRQISPYMYPDHAWLDYHKYSEFGYIKLRLFIPFYPQLWLSIYRSTHELRIGICNILYGSTLEIRKHFNPEI